MKPNSLLIGWSGQLGSELLYILDNVVCLNRNELDLENLNLDTVQYLDKFKIDCIINAAAYTNVDGAELDKELVFKINNNATKILADYALKRNIKLVQYSSDFVFDSSDKQKLHNEDSEKATELGVYAQSKLKMEEYLENLQGLDFLLIRTSWVYGNSNNFVRTIRSLLGKTNRVEVIDDSFGSPTSSFSLAKASKYLIENNLSGTFNFSNSGGPISWYDFAEQIAKYSGFKKSSVVPITTTDFLKKEFNKSRKIAKRPENSTLNLNKFTKLAYRPEEWKSELNKYIAKNNQKVILFPGSFDPFHKGHIKIVRDLAKEKEVNRIFIIPRIKSAHKESLESFDTRLKLIELALKSSRMPNSLKSKIKVLKIESDKEYNLNFETIKSLRRKYTENSFELILGADVIEQFNKWQDSNLISRLVDIREVNLINLDGVKISSSLFKSNKTNNKKLVLKPVYDKIISDKLY